MPPKKCISGIEELLKQQAESMKGMQTQLGLMISKGDALDSKVSNLNDNVIAAFKTRVDKVESATVEARKSADEATALANANEASIREQQKTIDSLNKQFNEYTTRNSAWQEKLVTGMMRDCVAMTKPVPQHRPDSRERNLVFSDVEEGEDPSYSQDILFLREYFKQNLGLSHFRAYHFIIKDAYRRGRSDRPRDLVVTLSSDDDLWYLIKAANRNDAGGNVQRDFTPAVARCRTSLERLRYSLTKGGITGQTIDYPADLKHNGESVRNYFPNLAVNKDDTVAEAQFANDLSDLPEDLRLARDRGRDVIKGEKAARVQNRGRLRQESGDTRREREGRSHSPGRNLLGPVHQIPTAR